MTGACCGRVLLTRVADLLVLLVLLVLLRNSPWKFSKAAGSDKLARQASPIKF